MSSSLTNKKKVNSKQMEIIVNFMENHPEMAKNSFGPEFSSKIKSRNWEKLCDLLNAEEGVCKTKEKWVKCWIDYKASVKSKNLKHMRDISGTGDDTPKIKPLNDLEQRTLNIMGQDAVSGLQGVEESFPCLTVLAESDRKSPSIFDGLYANFNSPQAPTTQATPETQRDTLNIQVQTPTRQVPATRKRKRANVSHDNCKELIKAQNNTADAIREVAEAMRKTNSIKEARCEIEKQKAVEIGRVADIMSHFVQKHFHK